jgi:hypothetical protein
VHLCRVVYPRVSSVPSDQYVPKHRAAPAPELPAAFAGPRHVGDKRSRAARRGMRTPFTLSGLAMAATGVAVVTGVGHAPHSVVPMAGAIAPVSASAASPTAPGADFSRNAARRSAPVSRSFDRRASRDPAKQAALGLTSGPAVGGQQSLSAQDPQAIADALLSSYGWSSSEMSCLVPLWMGESGWRVNAENASSGAYGIPQSLPGSKMASAGADWRTNPVTQIKWGLGYIQERYGSPCGAWGFKQGHGWY